MKIIQFFLFAFCWWNIMCALSFFARMLSNKKSKPTYKSCISNIGGCLLVTNLKKDLKFYL